MPASTEYEKSCSEVTYMPPLVEGGMTWLYLFCAMSRKVRNVGSASSFGDLSAANVDGTLWIALAKLTTWSVSAVRYLTSSQAAF